MNVNRLLTEHTIPGRAGWAPRMDSMRVLGNVEHAWALRLQG